MRTIVVRFETPDTTDPDQFLSTMFGDFTDMNKDHDPVTYTILERGV